MGGSGGSGFADSGFNAGPGRRNASGSNPSNLQSSEANTANPLNFIALLNSLNPQGFPQNVLG